MTVRLTDQSIVVLEGICTIDDTEPLVRLLLSTPQATVDWRLCEEAHTAIIQILLASRVALRGPPSGAFLRDNVEPLIARPTIDSGDSSSRMPGR